MKRSFFRIFSLVLALMLTMLLCAACGSQAAQDTTAATNATAETEFTTHPAVKREVTAVGERMRHLSYNLAGSNGTERYPNFADNLYKQRNFKALIEELEPDTFGVQESPQAWREGIVTLFEGKYAVAGSTHEDIVGDEKIWINSVYYRTDKFTCLDEGVIFLGENFKMATVGMPRSLSYAYLERIEDGERLLVVSCHITAATLGDLELRESNLKNYGEDQADRSYTRDKQVERLATAIDMKLTEYAETYDKEISVIACGDFNINYWTDNKYSHEYSRLRQTMSAIAHSPGMEDSALLAETLVTNQTREQWRTYRPTGVTDPNYRLDYIFVSSNIQVDTHAVYVHKEATDESSDHYPVYTDYYIGH